MDYARKPLPPLPLYRRPVVTSFNSEVNDAFATPKASQDGSPFLFDWEGEDSGNSARLHQGLDGGNSMPSPLKLKQRRTSTSAVGAGSDPATDQGTREWAAPENMAELDSVDTERPIIATDNPLPARRPHIVSAINTNDTPMVPPDAMLSPQAKPSVQKILKLTGNMAPTTHPSADIPTLHNSWQKIWQITGLDVSAARSLSENQLETLEEEICAMESEASSSAYSRVFPEDDDCSSTRAESAYAHSYVDSINEIATPLTVPRHFSAIPTSSAAPARHFTPDQGISPSPIAAALRLSGFVAADAGVFSPEDCMPIEELRRGSWYHHGESDPESIPSEESDEDEISESEFEQEPTAAELYHDTAVSLARRDSPRSSLRSAPHTNSWSQKLGPDIVEDIASNSGSPVVANQSSILRSASKPTEADEHRRPSSRAHFSLKPFASRKKDVDAIVGLSERRGHTRPSRLETGSSARSGGAGGWRGPPLLRTPYPPVSSSLRSTVEDAEDNQTRFSLLSRIFTPSSSNGGGSASINSNHSGGGKRTSGASTASESVRARSASLKSQPGAADSSSGVVSPPTSAWSPDTPRSSTFTDGILSSSGSGVFARAFGKTRVAKSKEDKTEKKRENLRGKIKVLREPEEGGSEAGEDKSG